MSRTEQIQTLGRSPSSIDTTSIKMVAAWKGDTLKRGLARRLKGKLASQSNYITFANESGHLVDARELRSSAIWWFESSRPTFEIFPFFGDASQRLGAMSTAWWARQSERAFQGPMRPKADIQDLKLERQILTPQTAAQVFR